MDLPEDTSLPDESPDEDIVARVCAGDAGLFELLMRRHNQRVYRAARAIVRNEDEAEDVMQHAYVRAYEHLHEFEGRARFATWVTRIAVHEALARTRHARRFEPMSADSEDAAMPHRSASPEEHVSDREMRALLEPAIDALPDEFRAVFVLRAVEELSGAETAEVLGIPEETVKTRLFRARGRLQLVLLHSLEPRLARTFEFQRPRCDRVVRAVLRRIAR
jgi:RNA polymerase sigma-70 factor (ECF subfamily)